MNQLQLLKEILGNPTVSDLVLQFYLDRASDVICDIRNSDYVEPKYVRVQLQIAVELFNKNGAEGQTSHGENGINRAYESGDISPSLLKQITPFAKTPFSNVREIGS